MRSFRATISILAIAVAAGCASGGSSASGTPRYSQNVITAEELATVDVNDAYQAVQRLRPQFLTASRGPTRVAGAQGGIQVYLNGQRVGGVTALQQIPKNDVKEIRFLSASEATTRFGTGNTAGAIVVTRN